MFNVWRLIKGGSKVFEQNSWVSFHLCFRFGFDRRLCFASLSIILRNLRTLMPFFVFCLSVTESRLGQIVSTVMPLVSSYMTG